jgi:penicillin-binding protein 1A
MTKNPFKWYARLYKGRPWYIKILSGLVSLILFIILYLGAVDINLFNLFGQSPSMDDIRSTRPPQASVIYSADGVLLGKFFNENRTPVKYEEVAPVFWQALIDTEDERFYSHFGIDIPAFFAAAKDYVLHRGARGASTITQQLAKNLFRMRTDYSTGLLGKVPGLRMLVVKSKEWVTSLKLEWNFSKEEILTMYANTVDFGSNAYGIKTACSTYFGITPKELKAEQAATLVGMLKATTTYNPRLNPENSLKRRNIVLDNMRQHGHLSQAEYDSLCREPIVLNFNPETVYDGEASYFRGALQGNLQAWCHQHGMDLYSDGLTIYTTIDMRMQRYAEEAAREQMRIVQDNFNHHWGSTNPWQDRSYREIPNFIENIAKKLPCYKALEERFPDAPDSVWHYMNLPHDVKLFSYDSTFTTQMSTLDSLRYMARFMHCGFMAMEPHTGHVKAWVGDIDFDTWKYDKVTALRQPGSTFKLFVYTEAMNQGMTPCKTYVDTYYNIGGWSPHNANGSVSGAGMTLRSAFAKSVNTIAAKLGSDVGISRVARTAHAMGIKSRLEEVPSLALGASDVSLLELVTAYSTVVNDGRVHQPVFVTRILNRDGHEVFRAVDEQQEAIPYRSAFFMQQMLQGGLSGTSWSLRQYVGDFMDDTDFGGKTGTSNNHSDAWFIGVSPKLVCGAWVGGEYRAIHFRTGQLGQGSATALPICGRFLKSVLADSRFPEYHAKFEACRDTTIDAGMYQCFYSYNPLDSVMIRLDDSLNEMLNDDSHDLFEHAPMDGDGNEEEAPVSYDAPVNNAEATEP